MLRVLKAEFMKLRHSRIVLLSVAIVCAFPLAAIPYLVIVKDPGRAAEMGLIIGNPATNPYAEATWRTAMNLNATSMGASWGIMMFGWATAFLFGREYTEGMAKQLLTLPVRRANLILGKFLVLAMWVAALTVLSTAVQAGVAVALGLGGFSWAVAAEGLRDALLVSALIFATLPLISWLAMLGRGYLPPLGVSALCLVLSSSIGFSAWAKWYPWAMPQLLTGAIWNPGVKGQLGAESWLVALGLFAVGVAVNFLHIEYAENAQ